MIKGNFKKLLCFLITFICLFGFGGVVRAYNNISVSSARRLDFRKATYFQYLKDSNGNPVYCLNQSLPNPSGQIYFYDDTLHTQLWNTGKYIQVYNIMEASKNITGLSDGEVYYITQTAIWRTLGNHSLGGNISDNFVRWVESSRYKDAWNTLMEAASEAQNYEEPKLDITGDFYRLNDNGTDLVSGNVKVGGTFKGDVTVSIASDSSENSKICYNGNCSTSVVVPKDGEFYLTVPKSGRGEDKVIFYVDTNQKQGKPKILTYSALNVSGLQNIAVLGSEGPILSARAGSVGSYDTDTSVKFKKIDEETENAVAGAYLEILQGDTRLYSFLSTVEGVEIDLPVGNYSLREVNAPNGYILNNASVDFSIVNDGGNLKIQQNGAIVSDGTIKVSDKKRKVQFRKVDTNGNGVAGVKITITDYALKQSHGENAEICGITGEDGYFATDCAGNTLNENEKVFDFHNAIYSIYEECTDDNLCGSLDFGLFSHTGSPTLAFGINESSEDVVLIYPNLSYSKDDNLFTITLKNNSVVDISKTDISGNEIAGAHMKICKKGADCSEYGNGLVEAWESGTSPFRFSTIEKGVRYYLIEDYAPEGYIQFQGRIEFELVDNKGTIKTYNPDTGEELDSYQSKLVMPNDTNKITISKTSVVTGEEISGAKLKICTQSEYESNGVNCSVYRDDLEWISSSTPHEVSMLNRGTYYLIEEVAPVGYVKKTTATEFTVNENGVVSSPRIELTNAPTKLTIAKKDEKGDYLVGAGFQILNASDRSIAYDLDGNELSWTSTDSNKEIYGLASGNYILVETVYPEGYQEGMIIDNQVVNEYEFSIGENDNDVNIDVYIEVLNAPNTGISTLNLFAIGGLMIFIGYETIKIYRRKALVK